MSKKAFERKLAALDELRLSPAPEAADALRKALRDRNNYAVSKAAAIVAELGSSDLVPDLLAAFDRFFENAEKTDPQCWAKNALSAALTALGHDDAQTYLRGLAHTQMEPVWGGRHDTAATLRATCALALVQCRNLGDLGILARLTETLVDPEKTVRSEAARAIGCLGRPEGTLPLRLKALVNDAEPEAVGACFSALHAIEGRAAIPFMERFLDAADERAEEAAAALALTREPEAFEILKRRWERGKRGPFAAALVAAIALMRMPEAFELLVQVVEGGLPGAETAIRALAAVQLPADLGARLETAAEKSGNPRR
ncbi:MAG: HEAT repeat domain-containing protein [Bryobacteraceae bacterium]|nr:HEAT repeat domain-containing protein [Bryobacteraceae bacterium]